MGNRVQKQCMIGYRMIGKEFKAFNSCAANILRLYEFVWLVVVSMLAYFYSETKGQEQENGLSS